uniref:Uncharacterized protein n=1 Tax=uncultured bacterium AR_412 TaxID=1630013 RepID=A0A0E3JHV6_9BACT|nr:hypothetical protein [uncultured bacterium AR_412]
MNSESRLDRLALARHILTLDYPYYGSAWLKASPVSWVHDESQHQRALAVADTNPEVLIAVRRQIMQTYLEDHFYNDIPEHASYSTFVYDSTWRPLSRVEMLQRVDTILAAAAARIAKVAAEEATRRSKAEAGGYLDKLPAPEFADLMVDLEALRRWFTAELWDSVEPTWFDNGRDMDLEPAVIAVDGDFIAILWLQ